MLLILPINIYIFAQNKSFIFHRKRENCKNHKVTTNISDIQITIAICYISKYFMPEIFVAVEKI